MTPTAIAAPTAAALSAMFPAKALLSADSTLTDRLDTVCRFVRYGELPGHYDAVAYGIQWSRRTGRLSGQVETALRGLNRRQLAALVVACATDCRTAGQVPAWLANRLAK